MQISGSPKVPTKLVLREPFFEIPPIAAMLLCAMVFLLVPVEAGFEELDNEEGYNIRTFSIDLDAGLPRMLHLVRESRMPDRADFPSLSADAGLDVKVLASLQTQWLHSFNWAEEQDRMNDFDHFKVDIEHQTAHFIEERSTDPDAIPLLLLHGWPGSFLEFDLIIRNLTAGAVTSSGRSVSFHVVVPSLPGFAFSSAPPINWTTNDTARIYNKLMASVLGYSSFAVHGTDWGAPIAYTLYDCYNSTVRAAHLVLLPFPSLTRAQLEGQNISLDALESSEEARFIEWSTKGQGYFLMQSTKPNTIGLALQENPIGQLAWIADQFISWSDPTAGTAPSLLTHNEILKSVSLYYLTGCFLSSISMYYQNSAGLTSEYRKAATNAPLLFSSFKYNPGFWPPELVNRVGNLVMYHNHEVGGHFPGLENPMALVEDLREIGVYWERD